MAKKDVRTQFVSHRKRTYISYARLDLLFAALGFYLADKIWFEKKITMQTWDNKKYLAHSDPIDYSCKTISPSYSKARARTFIVNEHFKKKRVFALNRRYTYVECGETNIKAQNVVCFDIDGRSNKDSTAAARELVRRFPQVKFIEHSDWSNGYHVYIHFDHAIFDSSLERLEAAFGDLGYKIEAIRSTGHIRLPMGYRYNSYGLYDPEQNNLVRNVTFDKLLEYWDGYKDFAYFDPSFEMEEPAFHKPFRGSYKKKKDAQEKLVAMLMENSTLDYGPHERDIKVKRILGYCIRYGLSKNDFVKICKSHDTGARGETDYDGLYKWGLTHFDRKEVIYKTNYEDILDRVQRYSTTKELPKDLSTHIEGIASNTLITFLKKRLNACKRGSFKNEELIKQRYLKQIKSFVLFLIQYQEAREKEWSLFSSPDLILPMVLFNFRRGIPLPLSFIRFLGKKYKSGKFPEVKTYLEQIGLLKAIELKPGVKYAPGTCIYYDTNFKIIS
jgi:hypothetical protein